MMKRQPMVIVRARRVRLLAHLCGIASVLVTLTLLGSCLNLPTPTYPSADAFVSSELASLAPDGAYEHFIIDFSQSRESATGVADSGIEFKSFTSNIGFTAGVAVVGDEAPPEGRFVGSTEHLRLAGAGSIELPSPSTVLGMHVVLTHAEALRHRWMASGTDARLLVTGIDRSGNATGTVKVTPAISTQEKTAVEEQWLWADLSILGEVTELEVSFESPMTELPVILIDNLTYSPDFASAPDFFTVALLPDTSTYVADSPEILGAQARFLWDTARRRGGEPIVFVSHLGGLVSDGADEDQWEAADEAMKILDGSVPYGTAPAASDMDDPEDPELGWPFYLETFPPDRFRDHNRRFGASEDEYSSYQIVDSPVGEILSLHLGVDPTPETLEWAQLMLWRHRDKPTILTVPTYMDVREGVVTRRSNPVLSNFDDTWTGLPGQTIWDELVWQNDQVFLVVCGDGRSEAVSIGWNSFEHPVIEMLASYDQRPNGGEGYLRFLRFYPARNELRVITYSPWLDTYEQDADSYFRIPLDISGRLGLE